MSAVAPWAVSQSGGTTDALGDPQGLSAEQAAMVNGDGLEASHTSSNLFGSEDGLCQVPGT